MLRISCGHPNALVALYVTSTGKFHTELSNPPGEGQRGRSSAEGPLSIKGQQFRLQSQATPLQSQAPTGEPVSAFTAAKATPRSRSARIIMC